MLYRTHSNIRRSLAVLLSLLVAASSGCFSFDPYYSSVDLARLEVAGDGGALQLEQVINEAAELRQDYQNGATVYRSVKKGVQLALVPLSAVALGLGITNVGGDTLTILGLTGAGMFVGGNLLSNDLEAEVVRTGSSALGCAIDYVEPFARSKAEVESLARLTGIGAETGLPATGGGRDPFGDEVAPEEEEEEELGADVDTGEGMPVVEVGGASPPPPPAGITMGTAMVVETPRSSSVPTSAGVLMALADQLELETTAAALSVGETPRVGRARAALERARESIESAGQALGRAAGFVRARRDAAINLRKAIRDVRDKVADALANADPDLVALPQILGPLAPGFRTDFSDLLKKAPESAASEQSGVRELLLPSLERTEHETFNLNRLVAKLDGITATAAPQQGGEGIDDCVERFGGLQLSLALDPPDQVKMTVGKAETRLVVVAGGTPGYFASFMTDPGKGLEVDVKWQGATGVVTVKNAGNAELAADTYPVLVTDVSGKHATLPVVVASKSGSAGACLSAEKTKQAKAGLDGLLNADKSPDTQWVVTSIKGDLSCKKFTVALAWKSEKQPRNPKPAATEIVQKNFAKQTGVQADAKDVTVTFKDGKAGSG